MKTSRFSALPRPSHPHGRLLGATEGHCDAVAFWSGTTSAVTACVSRRVSGGPLGDRDLPAPKPTKIGLSGGDPADVCSNCPLWRHSCNQSRMVLASIPLTLLFASSCKPREEFWDGTWSGLWAAGFDVDNDRPESVVSYEYQGSPRQCKEQVTPKTVIT